jgi:hypothetical protein
MVNGSYRILRVSDRRSMSKELIHNRFCNVTFWSQKAFLVGWFCKRLRIQEYVICTLVKNLNFTNFYKNVQVAFL